MKIIPFSIVILLIGLNACGVKQKDEVSNFPVEGEFTHRINLTKERLTSDRYRPVFTEEFILADVNINLEDPRRFYNYSGDLSGRYIEALSPVCAHDGCDHLDEVVKGAISYQKEDGRFGDEKLIFTEDYIDKDHTALLWGNGRLLVGLLEYYKNNPDEEVLNAARKIGDFFLGTYNQVTPQVVKRLEGQGAAGVICFTQYAGPLTMLSIATGDPKYAQVGAKVYHTLPERGVQHTHGYLTTLRGVLELYEYDDDIRHLEFVKNKYNDLINSSDYTIFGSVAEYFGGKGTRDEACSTVDFIRLSLHLYKLTGDISYIDRAEFAIYNSLYFNQFFNGDFGHQRIDAFKSGTGTMNAAWWCCTMSGLRAFQIVRDEYFIESEEGKAKLNLYIDTEYEDQNLSLSVRKGEVYDGFHSFNIKLDRVPGSEYSMGFRKPSWAGETAIYLNGENYSAKESDGYYYINGKFSSGDMVQLRMKYATRLILPDRRILSMEEVSRPVMGALCYGPHILVVDNNLDYTFLAEPSNNVVYSHTISPAYTNEAVMRAAKGSFVWDAYVTANYKHGGFPSYYQAVFRPISEMTFQRHPMNQISVRFVPESAMDAKFVDATMVDPWMEP